MEDAEKFSSWANYNITGPVDAVFQKKLIRINKMRYSVQYDEKGQVINIDLIAEFEPNSLKRFSGYFSLIEDSVNEGHFIYSFKVKENLINKHKRALSTSATVQQLLSAGEGTCLNMESYSCTGYGRF
jgi:hypothetical protein